MTSESESMSAERPGFEPQLSVSFYKYVPCSVRVRSLFISISPSHKPLIDPWRRAEKIKKASSLFGKKDLKLGNRGNPLQQAMLVSLKNVIKSSIQAHGAEIIRERANHIFVKTK